jgi:hypothetical protein
MFKNISIVTRGKPKTVVVGQFQGEGLDADSAGVDPAGWSAWAASKEQGAGDLGQGRAGLLPGGARAGARRRARTA